MFFLRQKPYDRRILLLSLMRSGYHAVQNWICRNMPGRVVFLNQCNEHLDYANKYVYKNSRSPRTLICSFENFDIEGFVPLNIGDKFDEVIIILRDPYNWIASSLKKGGKHADMDIPIGESRKGVPEAPYFSDTKGRIEIYKDYMKQILGEADFLNHPFIDINFTKWFQSRDYRMMLADRIGIGKEDKGLNELSDRGKGSSFDFMEYKGKARQMDVLGRWKVYADDERFKRFLDAEMKDYADRYFEFKPL